MVDSGLSVGVSGGSRDGAVVVADASVLRAVCHQERLTRVRRVLVLDQSVLQT